MRGRSLTGLVAVVFMTLLAAAALRDFSRLGPAAPWNQLYDFGDFYCAGSALNQRADPYRYEPLHRCEHAVNRTDAYRFDPQRTLPAPLPPYDFAPLVVLARAPFSTARLLDAMAIVAGVTASILLLSKVAVPIDIAALALALPAGYVLLAAGQVVPFALLAVVSCGVALQRQRNVLAGVLAALTLIEPHLGLPVWVAILLLRSKCRVAAVTTAVALLCVGVALVGPATFAEYVGRVLPAQAAAEHAYVYQYGLTYLLTAVGVPLRMASPLGDLSYFVMLAFAVLAGNRVANALRRPELLVFVPAACSVIGGPYVHMVDLAVAVPAALVLAIALSGAQKTAAAIAVALLAIPWIPVWIAKKLLLATLFVVIALLGRLHVGKPLWAASVAAIAVALYLLELSPPAPLVGKTIGTFAGTDLAQSAWAAYIAQLGHPSVLWLFVKVPTWIAMAILLVLFLRISLERRGERVHAD